MKTLLTTIFVAMTSLYSVASTQKLQHGCGWSDLVYDYIVATMNEKSKANIPIDSKGEETGRRLYIYNDNTWFLTLEFLSSESTEKDITCIVATGNQDSIKSAMDFEVHELPKWIWGNQFF